MGTLIDLTGKRFGRIKVLSRYYKNNQFNKVQWNCKCDCGTRKVIVGEDLKKHKIVSCGCYHKERLIEVHTIHGLYKSKLYRMWINMKQRCLNENNPSYKDYGGRGINIIPDWLDFYNFENWANNNGYYENSSIDRIDNDKGYYPENCRFTNRNVQSQNTRKLRSNNTSGYRGVSFNKHNNKYQSQITINSKVHYLGQFNDAETAAYMYDTYVINNNLHHTKNFSQECYDK